MAGRTGTPAPRRRLWRGVKDGYVFTTGWGEPIYLDTVLLLKRNPVNKISPLMGVGFDWQ